jgi:hypothetical protein
MEKHKIKNGKAIVRAKTAMSDLQRQSATHNAIPTYLTRRHKPIQMHSIRNLQTTKTGFLDALCLVSDK